MHGRYTFLRQHVERQLSRVEKLDVLAVEELLFKVDEFQKPGLNRLESRRLVDLVNLRQFFYRDIAGQRLYVPQQILIWDLTSNEILVMLAPACINKVAWRPVPPEIVIGTARGLCYYEVAERATLNFQRSSFLQE